MQHVVVLPCTQRLSYHSPLSHTDPPVQYINNNLPFFEPSANSSPLSTGMHCPELGTTSLTIPYMCVFYFIPSTVDMTIALQFPAPSSFPLNQSLSAQAVAHAQSGVHSDENVSLQSCNHHLSLQFFSLKQRPSPNFLPPP